MNPYRKVNPGESLQIAAATWNRVIDEVATRPRFDGGGAMQPKINFQVRCRNSTSGTVPRWGILAITGVLETPTGTTGSTGATGTGNAAFESFPGVVGVTPATGTTTRFVVALEPIPAGSIGMAAIDGVVQAKLDIKHASHMFANPKPGSTSEMETAPGGPAAVLWKANATGVGQWGLVRIGAGPAGLCVGKITATWVKSTTASVTQYSGDGSQITGATFVAMNRFATIAASGSSAKWVACGLVDTTWHLIAAECE